MKFALALVTLALVAAVNASPAGTFFDTELPASSLEQVQIDVRQIGQAEANLQITEDKLKALSEGATTVSEAKEALKEAVDVSALRESFEHDSALNSV